MADEDSVSGSGILEWVAFDAGKEVPRSREDLEMSEKGKKYKVSAKHTERRLKSKDVSVKEINRDGSEPSFWTEITFSGESCSSMEDREAVADTSTHSQRRYRGGVGENNCSMQAETMTAFDIFWDIKRPALMLKYTEMKQTQMRDRLRKKWDDMPDDKKSKYRKMAEEKCKAMKNRDVLEDTSTGNKIFQEIGMENPKKFKEDTNILKNPKRPFYIFVDEQCPLVKKKYPKFNGTRCMIEIGKKWRNLPPEKRQKYVNIYKKSLEKFREERQSLTK